MRLPNPVTGQLIQETEEPISGKTRTNSQSKETLPSFFSLLSHELSCRPGLNPPIPNRFFLLKLWRGGITFSISTLAAQHSAALWMFRERRVRLITIPEGPSMTFSRLV